MYDITELEPFTDWLSKLKNIKGRIAIAVRIDRARSGNLGDVESVGDGISEMRIHKGPGYRVYFTLEGQKLIVLLCGGDKSSQKKDIAKAKEIAKKWKDNNEN